MTNHEARTGQHPRADRSRRPDPPPDRDLDPTPPGCGIGGRRNLGLARRSAETTIPIGRPGRLRPPAIQEESPLSTRVHELAKELGLKSQELLDRIQGWGLDVKPSIFAGLAQDQVERIKGLMTGSSRAGRRPGLPNRRRVLAPLPRRRPPSAPQRPWRRGPSRPRRRSTRPRRATAPPPSRSPSPAPASRPRRPRPPPSSRRAPGPGSRPVAARSPPRGPGPPARAGPGPGAPRRPPAPAPGRRGRRPAAGAGRRPGRPARRA